MFKTEAEAKECWCPFSRVNPLRERSSFNRYHEETAGKVGPDSANCIASRCMAWRWRRKPNPDWQPEPFPIMSPSPPRDPRTDPPMYIADETRGYCGLATRPD